MTSPTLSLVQKTAKKDKHKERQQNKKAFTTEQRKMLRPFNIQHPTSNTQHFSRQFSVDDARYFRSIIILYKRSISSSRSTMDSIPPMEFADPSLFRPVAAISGEPDTPPPAPDLRTNCINQMDEMHAPGENGSKREHKGSSASRIAFCQGIVERTLFY